MPQFSTFAEVAKILLWGISLCLAGEIKTEESREDNEDMFLLLQDKHKNITNKVLPSFKTRPRRNESEHWMKQMYLRRNTM